MSLVFNCGAGGVGRLQEFENDGTQVRGVTQGSQGPWTRVSAVTTRTTAFPCVLSKTPGSFPKVHGHLSSKVAFLFAFES